MILTFRTEAALLTNILVLRACAAQGTMTGVLQHRRIQKTVAADTAGLAPIFAQFIGDYIRASAEREDAFAANLANLGIGSAVFTETQIDIRI